MIASNASHLSCWRSTPRARWYRTKRDTAAKNAARATPIIEREKKVICGSSINPYPLFDDPQITFFSRSMIGVALAAFLAAVSLFVRYHRARGVERQQLKWLAFEAIILAVAVSVGSFDQTDKWASVFLIAAIA